MKRIKNLPSPKKPENKQQAENQVQQAGKCTTSQKKVQQATNKGTTSHKSIVNDLNGSIMA